MLHYETGQPRNDFTNNPGATWTTPTPTTQLLTPNWSALLPKVPTATAAISRTAEGDSATFSFDGTDTVNALSFGGIARPPGVYSAANSPFITGSGTLTVSTGPATDYDGWATFHNLLTSGPSGDDDQDGVTNLSEYAFGLDPKHGTSTQPITSIPVPPSGAFTYTRRRSSLTGLTFSVWTSTNLADWFKDAAAVQSVVSSTGDMETVDVSLNPGLLTQPKLFIQLRTE